MFFELMRIYGVPLWSTLFLQLKGHICSMFYGALSEISVVQIFCQYDPYQAPKEPPVLRKFNLRCTIR